MTDEQKRVVALVRSAFRGVTLGEGVGLFEGRGHDDYANTRTLAEYRVRDEKHDWSAIPVADLNHYGSSLCFFDAEGMRFHLPAYLIAHLEGTLSEDIIFHLTYLKPKALSRFEKLSVSQRDAVRAFLLLHLTDPESDFDWPMVEKALSEYWNPSNKP